MISAYETDKLPQGYYTYSGTVLLRRDSSGAGQSLLLLLRDLGMRWVNAPGATGRKSRFGAATEPLIWAEFHLYSSAKGVYLQSAEVKEDFLNIRSSPGRLLTAMRCYKRTRRILLAEHESNHILTILWNMMLALNENCPEKIVEFRFNWRLLKSLGLAPSLNSCCECGASLEYELNWSRDGLLCARCGGTADKSFPDTLKSLQLAALLDQRRFVEWAKRQADSVIFKEHNKELVSFFSNFS